jgi:hypothetical protein
MPPCATTCPAALDLTSLPRGLQRCHVSHSPGPHLPTKVGSSAAMHPVAPDLTSLLR